MSHLLQAFLWFYAPGGTCAAVMMGNAVRFGFKAGVWYVDELPAPLPVVWPFRGFSDISVLCAEFQASCTHSAFGMRCCVLSFWRPFQQLGGLLGV
jgi:hypothetical protein